jgi:hypothetical protein
MATKTGTFGVGGPGYKGGHFTSQGVWISDEVAAAAAAGPSIEEILAEMDAEEAEIAAAEKAEKE